MICQRVKLRQMLSFPSICEEALRNRARLGRSGNANGSLRHPGRRVRWVQVSTASGALKKKPSTVPPGVRMARVQTILNATLEHLAFVGYRALSIEDIAQKAGVAKTTIYRRWPTKKDLVKAALESAADGIEVKDTGSLRGDLLALGREFLALASSTRGQSLLRICMIECADPQLEAISDEVRCQQEEAIESILHRAIARGELPPDTDPQLFLPAFVGPLHLKLFFNNERVDEVFMGQLIDLLLHGAMPASAPTRGTGDARETRPPLGRGIVS